MTIGLNKGQVASSAGAIYTNPASTTTRVKTILFHNTNTTAEDVILYLVNNSGGAVGTASASDIVNRENIPANGSPEFSPAYPFELTEENDTIQAVTTTGSVVNFAILGDTI